MYRYRTVVQGVRTKIAVGACRFYASLAPCATEEEAKTFLNTVREQLPGATHHASAYRFGWGDDILARCDDDGEPAGTAGMPLLAVLEKAELTNVALIATRFFGGVKLGIGGLVRAYRACGEAGVRAARICDKELRARLRIKVPYDYLGAVERETRVQGGEVLRHIFDQQVTLEVSVPLAALDGLDERMAAASRGKARLRRID